MKAFEKQYGEDCEMPVDCGDLSCKECKKIQAAVWREALLWFWKTAEHLSPSDYAILEEELK